MPTRNPLITRVGHQSRVLEFIEIKSTRIDSYAYLPEKKTLYLRFNNRPEVVYQYSQVDQKMLEAFLASDSKGKFFEKYIKDLLKFAFTV